MNSDDRVKKPILFPAGFVFIFFVASILFASLGMGQGSTVNPTAAIDKIRERCLAILQKAYASEDAFIRSAAVRAAGESEDPALLTLLKKASKDFYATARLFALQGIEKISPAETLLVARSLLEDKDAWVRSAALELMAPAPPRLSTFSGSMV